MSGGRGWKRLFRLEEAPRHIEGQIDEEFLFHIEERVEQLVSDGLSPEKARAEALRQFGDIDDFRNDCQGHGEERLRREAFGRAISSVWRDFRFGGRMLRKNPGFTALVLICLTLGIGATTAVFSVINAVIIQPLPFEDPGRLVMVWETFRTRNMMEGGVSYPNLEEWRRRNLVFEEIGAFHPTRHTLTGLELPERIQGGRADSRFFGVLGVNAAMGRTFNPEDDEPGSEDAVIISDGVWRRHFDLDPQVVGRELNMDERTYTIIGVLPAHFSFPVRVAVAEVWTSTSSEVVEKEQRPWPVMTAVGRLKPGVELSAAQEHMEGIAIQLEEEFPETNTEHGFNLVPLHRQTSTNVRPLLYLLLGSVVFVLLIACTNVANLLLARSSVLQGGLAVRTAMGAGRGDLIRQALSESVLLSLTGGALGALLAIWGTRILVSLIPTDFPRAAEISVNAPVLLFTLVLAVLTGLVFGVVPALQASRINPASALGEAGRYTPGRGHNYTRQTLVVLETALALVLLAGAGLLVRSFQKMMHVEPGFDSENVLTFAMSRDWSDYHVDRRAEFYLGLPERLTHLPGVTAAGAGTAIPLSGGFMATFTHEGQRDVPMGEQPLTRYLSVTPSYFETLRISLLRGRLFSADDRRDRPGVVVVNEAAARAFWPGEDPLGKHIYPDVDITSYDPTEMEIIGVVGDVRDISLDADAGPCIYVPCTQQTWPYMVFAVRTAGDPMEVAGAVRREILAMTEEATFSYRPLDVTLARSITQRRFPMVMIAIFAGLALVLAAAGIYGVLSYTVARRTREIGVRMALGAQPVQVVRMFMKQGMTLVAIGAGIGLAVSAVLSRVIAGMLFGVAPSDALTFAGVLLLLLSVALIACYTPVRRAAGVDPVMTLKSE